MGGTKAPKIVKSASLNYTIAAQRKRNVPQKQPGDYEYDAAAPSQLWPDEVKLHTKRKMRLEKLKKREQESIPPPLHHEMAGTPDKVPMDEIMDARRQAPEEDIDRIGGRPVDATPDVEMRMKFNAIYYRLYDAPVAELGDFWSHNLFSVLNRQDEA